ncbi:hypothetical protein RRG08_063232 [Elysia crispata]|uniref:Uncharacterized protein n=1 Tax=Elysia crispata TaxID=231223 RepID=A0AAE0Y9S9_9GAST|nr:hypothetical protein RRG08_063232 [Elysia crispata]
MYSSALGFPEEYDTEPARSVGSSNRRLAHTLNSFLQPAVQIPHGPGIEFTTPGLVHRLLTRAGNSRPGRSYFRLARLHVARGATYSRLATRSSVG